MIFDSALVNNFHRDGFTTVSQLFTPKETLALQKEVKRLTLHGLGRNVRTDGDGETRSAIQSNYQVIPLFDKSNLIRALPFESKIIQLVRQLIGEPFLLHLDQMFLKPAGQGTGTDWHQDNAYFKIDDPMKGVAMWVAVHDASITNGTLHVIPGSFRNQYNHERDPYSDHHIRCHPPENKAVAVEVPAGGVVFFCYGCAHCTKDNTSQHERAGMAFHFLNTEYAPPELITSEKNRPILTGPKATGGVAEYGLLVADSWKAEVDHILEATS